MTEYRVTCGCGRSIPVSAVAAGSEISCHCGRAVAVPPLSQLRESIGSRAFETSVLDRVRRLVREDSLRLSPCCSISQRPTNNLAWVQVQCERRWISSNRINQLVPMLLMSFLVPFHFLRSQLWSPDLESTEFGRDVFVDLPLPVDPEFRPHFHGLGNRQLKRLLRTVPEYAELLAEYPTARVNVID